MEEGKETIHNHQQTHEEVRREQFYLAAQEIVQTIMENDNALCFWEPVNPEVEYAPNYYLIIPSPMCFFEVQEKLDQKKYNCPEEFIEDVRTIWQNAKIYNNPSHQIYKTAHNLANKFEILASTLPHTLSESEKNSGLQRLVELRFQRYRMNKPTHQ